MLVSSLLRRRWGKWASSVAEDVRYGNCEAFAWMEMTPICRCRESALFPSNRRSQRLSPAGILRIARVIKIERPGDGDFCRDYDHVMNGMSSQFVWTNRSKESLAIDIKSPQGKKILDALLPKADVFIQNLALGAAERLGVDAASLVLRFPRIIACDVSGYGSGGSYSDKKAYDLLVQCEGILYSSGTSRRWRAALVASGCRIRGREAISKAMAQSERNARRH